MRFFVDSLVTAFGVTCIFLWFCTTSNAADNVLSQCSSDKLIIYKVVLHTFWTSSRFPKHYPQWRPPAQWSSTIDCKIMSNDSNYADIFAAAGEGDLAAVKYFVETQGVDVNSRIRASGETALFKAAQGGHQPVVEYLINRGANVRQTDKFGYNVLLWAVDNHSASLELIKYLVDRGADINCKDTDKGLTSLHWAAFHCDLNLVRYLTEAGARANAQAKNGVTPLMKAASKDCFQVVDYFINERNVQFSVYNAAENGLTSLVRYLSEKKHVSLTDADEKGWTVLHRAVMGGQLETVKYLVEEKKVDVNARNLRGNPASPLQRAIGVKNLEVIRYLTEHGADFKIRDASGRNLLYLAAAVGSLEIFKYFSEEKKLNIHAKDNYGNSNLHAAGWDGRVNILRYLINEKNMDPDIRDTEFGNTILIEAVQREQMEVFWFLLQETSADLDVRDNADNTALHYAARSGLISVVRALVEKGANFNIRNRDGRTALYFAADGTEGTGGHLSVVKYLVDVKKSDVFQRDNYGNTLLHAAEWFGTFDVVKYLVEEKGVDVNAKDNDGNTPLGEALSRGKQEISRYLESKGGKKSRRRRSANFGDEFVAEPYATNAAAYQRVSWIHSCGKYLTSVVTDGLIGGLVRGYNGNTDSADAGLTNKFDYSVWPLDTFLLLGSLATKFFSNSQADKKRTYPNRNFLSPQEIIEKRIDKTAIEATCKLSDVFDWKNF